MRRFLLEEFAVYNGMMKQKKTLTELLIIKYRKMSGDKKIRLGMQLSETVRKIRKEGMLATGC